MARPGWSGSRPPASRSRCGSGPGSTRPSRSPTSSDSSRSWAPRSCSTRGNPGVAKQGKTFPVFPASRSDGVVPLEDVVKEIDFRLLLEQLPAIVWATDRDLRFVYSRGAGLAALGLGADEVVGLLLSDHLGTRDPNDPTLAAHRAALAGVATAYELRHEGRVYQVHVEPWRAGSDGIVGALGVALDITGRARAATAP